MTIHRTIAHNITVALVGDHGVGKTTLMDRLITGEFTKNHVESENGAHYALYMNTTHGMVLFNVYEYESVDSMPLDVKNKFDCALVMFDLTNKQSFESVPNTCSYFDIENVAMTILCGNKHDRLDREMMPRNIQREMIDWNMNVLYYDISVKCNYQFEKAFIEFARFFIDRDLQLVEELAEAPPTAVIDEAVYQRAVNSLSN